VCPEIAAIARNRRNRKTRIWPSAKKSNQNQKSAATSWWLFYWSKGVNKEEMTALLKAYADKLGRVPSFPELQAATGITNRAMRSNFGNYTHMLEACGMERKGAGFRIGMNTLFMEWAGLVRKLGKLPTLMEYTVNSQYSVRHSVRPLMARFGGWKRVPTGLYYYAKKQGLDVEYKDVLDVMAAEAKLEPGQDAGEQPTTMPPRESGGLITRPPGILLDRPVYGPPLLTSPLNCEPTNEAGVIFLFGALAQRLGFCVTRLQGAFPDGEALREMAPGRWQRQLIEFEHESRNFLLHLHEPADCDLIVCWRHNWEDCPLEVLELKSVVGKQTLTTDPRQAGTGEHR
jgi:Homing endonuclease associated repeat